ncbi:hypothetical protein [Corynebacterium propinquum]
MELSSTRNAYADRPNRHPAPSCPPSWDARLSWVDALIKNKTLNTNKFPADELTHIIYPASFAENLQAILNVGASLPVGFAVRYGKKANKSAAFARVCADFYKAGADVGIDVASTQEFQSAISAGVPGPQIMVTGTLPSISFLKKIIDSGATLAICSMQDFELIQDLFRTGALSGHIDALLRVRQANSHARFGVSLNELSKIVSNLSAQEKYSFKGINLKGLSFHLNGYDATDRVNMISSIIPHLIALRNSQADPKNKLLLSIGGGFPAPSVDSDTWNEAMSKISPDMWVDGQAPKNIYPFGCTDNCTQTITSIMQAEIDSPHGHRQTVAKLLGSLNITVICEPGRSLCSKAGVTIAPVISTSSWSDNVSIKSNKQCHVTVVAGSSFSLSEQWFSSEFFPDPILLRNGTPVPADSQGGYAIAGATCLDSDYLSRRFIPLPTKPQAGDILLYIDTAGYQMDSNESNFHELAIPKKYVVQFDSKGNSIPNPSSQIFFAEDK